ncbi:phage tail sheath family protein [Roseibium aggregatum]|nr:phage tail sheath C-terminal domain-containing protein [Roseibium aggregatum]
MGLFFENGGHGCWILSVGCYGAGEPVLTKSVEDFGEPVWRELAKLQEPSVIVIPDAVLLSSDDYKTVSNRCLAHCTDLQNRFAIVDVLDGDRGRTYDENDVISGKSGLRTLLAAEDMSFAAAYYPWLNTSHFGAGSITFENVSAGTRKAFFEHVGQETSIQADEARKAAFDKAVKSFEDDDISEEEKFKTHKILRGLSKRYKELLSQAVKAVNVMPPSGALAGAYAATDARDGVWKAPANLSLNSVVSPCVSISDAEQEDLNTPLDGKAVNAIRSFPGRGNVVWGARTLDGNSSEWRYVNIRRTAIMLEQSIKAALDPFVFKPNTAPTWKTVKSVIENFLNGLWKQGALAGASPEDAYGVEVDLGTTMTGADVQAGCMNVVVKVSLLRPAEFIVLSFQQQVRKG